jgi:DNA invertase Pin-like site-specific DNA recombinase
VRAGQALHWMQDMLIHDSERQRVQDVTTARRRCASSTALIAISATSWPTPTSGLHRPGGSRPEPLFRRTCPMTKTAAIYARVSSDRQKESGSIASQTAALQACAQQRQYSVPPEWVFEDDGVSGARLDRPGLEAVRDLAAEGRIEAVLVLSPDRLSRKYAYQVLQLEEFARCGVACEFVDSPAAETPQERLLVQVWGMIAEYERALIVERPRRGKRHKGAQRVSGRALGSALRIPLREA